MNTAKPHIPRYFRELPGPIQTMFSEVMKYFWLKDVEYFYQMACFHGWAIHNEIPPISPAVSEFQFNYYGTITKLVIGDFWKFEYQGNQWVQTEPMQK